VLQGCTIGLFTFYLVADGPRLRRAVCSVLRPERQQLALRIWELAIESTGGYVYSYEVVASPLTAEQSPRKGEAASPSAAADSPAGEGLTSIREELST
jgi:hypothetical protein